MKVTGATTQPTLNTPQIPQKLFTTLLELVRPVGDHKALVLIKGMGEVPLLVNQALDERQLYHAVIQKSPEGLVLKELFKLPMQLKQILAMQPLMSLENLITQLSQGKSIQKTVFEALALQMLQSSEGELIESNLQQIIHLIQHHEIPIPLIYQEHQGYVTFKKREKKGKQYRLPFEAYFQKLGIITGSVLFFDYKKEAHLKVLSLQTKELLESHAKKLPMQLTVTIDTELKLNPTTALLDIQV